VKFIISTCFLSTLFFGVVSAQPTISMNLPNEIVLGEIYEASLNITNNQHLGKLSIKQIFPPGIIINEQNSNGALFSFSENELNLQWLETPDKENFTVEYSLFVPLNFKEHREVISHFNYSLDDKIVNQDLPVELLRIRSEEINTSQPNMIQSEAKMVSDKALGSDKQAVYKVQIGAFSNKISDEELSKTLGIEGYEISYFKHKGLHKYAIGNFTTKQEALQFKQDKLNKLSDSFIVVFIEGQRVDLEDAIELIKEETE
jgi:hypothetical protein